MSFWTSFNASKSSYFTFVDSLKGQDNTFNNVNSALDSLRSFKAEFQRLEYEASCERNAVVAQSKLQGVISHVDRKINNMLDALNYLTRKREELQQRINELLSKRFNLQQSINRDRERLNFPSSQRGNKCKEILDRITEKEKSEGELNQKLIYLKIRLDNL